MAIELDHFIVSARNQRASARLLGELLGVRWAETGVGPFSPVYLNGGLTLDFIDDDGSFPIEHFCFRVSEQEFDSILQRIRAAGIKFRSAVRGPEDMQVNTEYGGRMVYWNEPDGHQWEMLTASYARAPSRVGAVRPDASRARDVTACAAAATRALRSSRARESASMSSLWFLTMPDSVIRPGFQAARASSSHLPERFPRGIRR